MTVTSRPSRLCFLTGSSMLAVLEAILRTGRDTIYCGVHAKSKFDIQQSSKIACGNVKVKRKRREKKSKRLRLDAEKDSPNCSKRNGKYLALLSNGKYC